jgi:ferrous iron transport protein B
MENVTVALAGNPNTGKTSLFNNITGAKQHVGNWPGVTVEKREGEILYKGKLIKIVDLPGTYSLGAYSEDEIVAREYILNEKPDVIVNVIDATNLNRNLYLTVQLLEMDADVIIALNMMDETQKLGIEIDIDKLSLAIGAKVIPTVATKKQGIEKINKSVLESSKGKNSKLEGKRQFKIDYGLKVEEQIEQVIRILKENGEVLKKYPARWLAIKLLEDDEKIAAQIASTNNGKDIISNVKSSRECLEEYLGMPLDSYIITKRYEHINKVVNQCIRTPQEELVTATDKIDKVLTHKVFGLPIFIAIMFLVFTFTFTLSEPLVEWVESGFSALGNWTGIRLSNIGASKIFISFIVEGIIGGMGSVLGIVPVLFMLFVAIAILEDSGYMARIAYIMDRPMRKAGLHGKAFIPFLLGFGCNVPAVMSTRTLDNKRDRLLAIIANPFIPCGARLPVFVLFTNVFFDNASVYGF